MKVQRGDIYYADLSPVVGSEQGGVRPVLIVQNDVLQSFLAAVLVTVYAEVLARALRTPSTTFSIVSLIPLVPGSSLYYSMTAALSETYVDFLDRATYTLKIAAALSMGLILVTAVSKHVRLLAQRAQKQDA